MCNGKRETKVKVSNAGGKYYLKVFIVYHNWRIDTTGLTQCCSVFLRELLVVQLVKKFVASTQRRDNYSTDNNRCDPFQCTVPA